MNILKWIISKCLFDKHNLTINIIVLQQLYMLKTMWIKTTKKILIYQLFTRLSTLSTCMCIKKYCNIGVHKIELMKWKRNGIVK